MLGRTRRRRRRRQARAPTPRGAARRVVDRRRTARPSGRRASSRRCSRDTRARARPRAARERAERRTRDDDGRTAAHAAAARVGYVRHGACGIGAERSRRMTRAAHPRRWARAGRARGPRRPRALPISTRSAARRRRTLLAPTAAHARQRSGSQSARAAQSSASAAASDRRASASCASGHARHAEAFAAPPKRQVVAWRGGASSRSPRRTRAPRAATELCAAHARACASARERLCAVRISSATVESGVSATASVFLLSASSPSARRR